MKSLQAEDPSKKHVISSLLRIIPVYAVKNDDSDLLQAIDEKKQKLI